MVKADQYQISRNILRIKSMVYEANFTLDDGRDIIHDPDRQ